MRTYTVRLNVDPAMTHLEYFHRRSSGKRGSGKKAGWMAEVFLNSID